MISVDNDTSTSDTVAILANGAAGGEEIADGSAEASAFAAALRRHLHRDGADAGARRRGRGEAHRGGASKARRAWRTRALRRAHVSASPLVKTAVHGTTRTGGAS